MIRVRKRSILLLEVLISLALVVLCIFPLLAPHVYILKAQYQFNHKIALDQIVGKVYVRILEKLYQNEIPWTAIENKQTFEIDEDMESAAGIDKNFGYKGTYRLSIIRDKGGEGYPISSNVIEATLTFLPKDLSSDLSGEEKNTAATVFRYQLYAAKIMEKDETKNEEAKPPARNPA